MVNQSRLEARRGMNDRPRLETRGGRKCRMGHGRTISPADRAAQQAHELEVQRCDDQADVCLQAHAWHEANPGANAGTFLRGAQNLLPNRSNQALSIGKTKTAVIIGRA